MATSTNSADTGPKRRPGHDIHGRPGLRMGDHVFGAPAQPRVTGTAPGQEATRQHAAASALLSEERGQE